MVESLNLKGNIHVAIKIYPLRQYVLVGKLKWRLGRVSYCSGHVMISVSDVKY